jgi:transposase
MRYITGLTEKDKQQLSEGFRNGATHRFRIRCQSILLSKEGYQINQLATMFQVDRDTVSRWFDKWEAEGIAGLQDQPRSGRPAKLRIENAQHVKEVKKQVEKERQNLDKVRAELADSLQVEVSRKTLKRFLKSLVIDGSVSDYHSNQDKTL